MISILVMCTLASQASFLNGRMAPSNARINDHPRQFNSNCLTLGYIRMR